MFRIKSRFFENLAQTWNCREFWKKNRYFSKILSKIDIFETWKDFDQNPYFSNILTKIRILWQLDINLDISKMCVKSIFFEKFWSKWGLFENFDRIRGISKIFTEIKMFKGFDQNRYSSKFWSKLRYFENSDFNQDFSKILTKIKILGNLDSNRDVSSKIETFYEN